MFDPKIIDDLSRKISDLVPPGVKDLREGMDKNIKALVQASLGKLDLVTREEFDIQRKVLLRTREKLEALEEKLNADRG